MPTFDSQSLLNSLENDVRLLLDTLNNLKTSQSVNWQKQPKVGKWSPLQIIEHLNSYNRYYLPELSKALDAGRDVKCNRLFKSGWFGNYFTNMMQPGKDGLVRNKMSAPKNHRPQPNLDEKAVINEFIAGQEKLLGYLSRAKQTDIGKLRAPISISRFIKLKIGDTFRFLIAHQIRHFKQLDRTLAELQ